MSKQQVDLRGRDLLIDANLLLLGVIGAFDPRLLGKGRLDKFSNDDFALLEKIFAGARTLLTTPGILTETGNLSEHIVPKRDISEFFEHFRAFLKNLDERHERATITSEAPAFLWLGLTDATILHIAEGRIVVLTDDRLLFNQLLEKGIEAYNFNHLR
jgi:hypothetical protein